MRVGVVVDVSNLYYCTKKVHNRKVNYREVYAFAQEWGDVVYAAAYGAGIGDQSAKFEAVLNDIGFETHFKEPKIIKRSRSVKHKADWDVGIAVATTQVLPDLDHLILCTGDGDLAPLIEHAKTRNVLTWVLGTNISHELADVADETFEIVGRFLERR